MAETTPEQKAEFKKYLAEHQGEPFSEDTKLEVEWDKKKEQEEIEQKRSKYHLTRQYNAKAIPPVTFRETADKEEEEELETAPGDEEVNEVLSQGEPDQPPMEEMSEFELTRAYGSLNTARYNFTHSLQEEADVPGSPFHFPAETLLRDLEDEEDYLREHPPIREAIVSLADWGYLGELSADLPLVQVPEAIDEILFLLQRQLDEVRKNFK